MENYITYIHLDQKILIYLIYRYILKIKLMEKNKLSIVTVVKNSSNTIEKQ